MPRKPLTEEEKSVVRKKACAAARKIIDAEGVGKVTIRGVAREVGMSAMSLYTYFENKADLIGYLQAETLDELGAELAGAASTGGKPEDVVAALGAAYIAFADEHQDDFRLAFRNEETDGVMPDKAKRSLEDAMRPLHEAVADTIKEARSKSEVERIATAVWSAWHGYVLLRQAGCLSTDRAAFDPRTLGAAFRAVETEARVAH